MWNSPELFGNRVAPKPFHCCQISFWLSYIYHYAFFRWDKLHYQLIKANNREVVKASRHLLSFFIVVFFPFWKLISDEVDKSGGAWWLWCSGCCMRFRTFITSRHTSATKPKMTCSHVLWVIYKVWAASSAVSALRVSRGGSFIIKAQDRLSVFNFAYEIKITQNTYNYLGSLKFQLWSLAHLANLQ